MLSSHLTNNLDRGVRKLLAMWAFVKKDLENAFAMAQGEEEEDDDKESQQSGDAPTTGSRAGGASGSISLRTGHFTGEGSVSASAAYLQQVVPVEKFKVSPHYLFYQI